MEDVIMFRKLLGRATTTAIPIKYLPQNTRSFSTSDVEKWIKIYKKMQSEAGKIAEISIGNVKSEIDLLRSEVSSVRSDFRTEIAIVKSDIVAVKNDLAAVKADLTDFRVDINRQFDEVHTLFNEVHKQASSNVRLILAGMFGFGAATVTANQFVGAKLCIKHDDLASSAFSNKP
jgi:hypothetical protein